MFTDSIIIKLTAGKGGNGAVAWHREKYIPKGGPAGGNGGNGGSVYLQADTQMASLDVFRNRRLINAENGITGSSNHKHGLAGKDLVIKIPCGTLIKDAETGEVLYDFTQDKESWKVCQGGRGGKGNACFKSPTNQAPNTFTEGTEGEIRRVHLELKLIADIGLVGFPNAGKSTILSRITNAAVKIGAYPFTTLHPNLSPIIFDDYTRILVADIPGIIENAHKNRGLGIAFLKHIERTSVLAYVIDVSASEGRDPFEDFQILRSELLAYSEDLIAKPFLVILNKTDCDDAEEQVKHFRAHYPFDQSSLFEISAEYELGLEAMIEEMKRLVRTKSPTTEALTLSTIS
jgi:GTP-binding protein